MSVLKQLADLWLEKKLQEQTRDIFQHFCSEATPVEDQERVGERVMLSAKDLVIPSKMEVEQATGGSWETRRLGEKLLPKKNTSLLLLCAGVDHLCPV